MSGRAGFRQNDSKADYQRHHLIPVSVSSNRNFCEYFDGVRRYTGFDLRDFSSNGIFLPCTENTALASGRPLHRGPHPQYNGIVEQRVAKIFRSKAVEILDISKQHRLLRKLQRSLHRGLSSNSRGFILNRRDPLARKIDFRCIDDDLERLWSATEPA